jgi:uncharacterized protein involved in copper resistance
MNTRAGGVVVAALMIVGCSGGAERPAGEDASTAAVQSRDKARAQDSAAMAGMDHGRMAGMVHGGMAGMQGDSQSAAGQGGAQGVDHSEMHAPAREPGGAGAQASGRMAGMDHGTMEMSDQTRRMPGMDHAGMPSTRPGTAAELPTDDTGMEKLRSLVAELVQDPAVQAQIQADTALRRRWADDGVRRVLLRR